MTIIGIDPGLTGAIAIVNFGIETKIEIIDCPVIAGEMDCKSIISIFMKLPGQIHQVGIEKAQAMRKEGIVQGTVSMFNYGKGYGQFLGILHTLGIPFIEIASASWKRELMLLKQPKGMSIVRAKNLFPEAERFLRLKKHHGRADALLISEYTRRRIGTWTPTNQLTIPDADAEKTTIRFFL